MVWRMSVETHHWLGPHGVQLATLLFCKEK